MKIIGKFREFPLTEIFLYGTSFERIRFLLEDDSNIEKKVQEYKPRKLPSKIVPPDFTKRHQVVLSKEALGVLKIKLYSIPMNAKSIKELKLEPIEGAEKKERLQESLQRLTSNSQ